MGKGYYMFLQQPATIGSSSIVTRTYGKRRWVAKKREREGGPNSTAGCGIYRKKVLKNRK